MCWAPCPTQYPSTLSASFLFMAAWWFLEWAAGGLSPAQARPAQAHGLIRALLEDESHGLVSRLLQPTASRSPEQSVLANHGLWARNGQAVHDRSNSNNVLTELAHLQLVDQLILNPSPLNCGHWGSKSSLDSSFCTSLRSSTETMPQGRGLGLETRCPAGLEPEAEGLVERSQDVLSWQAGRCLRAALRTLYVFSVLTL
ncbi:hypothetical protein TREES_T100013130 [Tupaia chinensis]|uniref:Uncharacterized protein n=1 Tax=Tupaia chinensis TaxID=246437 RepID=L9KSW6_TUPCH|nr:hypothetical protein TREES_T100013130 [Tupaia chinensis]